MTADDKYSLCNNENLMESNEMQQSQNIKAFFQAFAQFLEATSNFKNFEKKDYPSSLCIFEITDCERHG